ncbi:hypothetical protein TNCT_580851 [Trichonephila clavata]|uniref:Phytanoyl-CoA dioxygenase n=1 Tax=Trichonephila clavata TaxID=2740835 RepID=A0A8X6LZZ6_TRICU|nr:hypothetical protein TNCT_580851 [Trichonephila clavata]
MAKLTSPSFVNFHTMSFEVQVSFYHEHVLVKEPGTDKETPWHHDQSYYPIDGDKVGNNQRLVEKLEKGFMKI